MKHDEKWKVKPTSAKKADLYQTMRAYLKRNSAVSRSLAETFKRLNEIVRGWINYLRIGMVKGFMTEFGKWSRHKIRVIILKQWKRPKIIYKNLSSKNMRDGRDVSHDDILKATNRRLGWQKRSGMNVVNYILNPKLLETKVKD